MKTFRHFLLTGLFIGLINVFFQPLLTQDAEAMPNFARRYQTSCVTCHSTYPVLNAVGDAFRLDGYRFRNDEQYIKEQPVEMGDEAYKKLWPQSMWPGHIPSNTGFSFAARMYSEIDVGHVSDTREGDVTFMLPHEAELSWAGNLGKGIAAYGDMIFVQEDYGTEDTTSWLMAKAWIEFSDLIGPEDAVNFRVGTVGVHTIGLYTAKDEQRIGLQYYQFNSWVVPEINVDKNPSLAAFTGNTFTNQPQLGIELSGFGKSWLYYAGIVNGNIDRDAGDVYFMGVGKNTDTKDYYGGFAYKIGGLGFNGSNLKGDNPLASQAEFWRDDSLTFSVFGYNGSAEIEVDRYDDSTYTTHTETTSDDDFWRFSVGAKGRYKDLTVSTGYQWAHDDNPYGILWDNDLDANTWFVETMYFIYPWLIPYARYEVLELDNVPLTGPTDDIAINAKQDSELIIVGIKAHLRANVHFTVEYQDFINPDFTSWADEIIFLQLMFSF